jgi:hypothetical protein
MGSKLVVIHAALGERLPLNASEKEVLRIVEAAAASGADFTAVLFIPTRGENLLPVFSRSV